MNSDPKSMGLKLADTASEADLDVLIEWLHIGKDPMASVAAVEIGRRFQPLIRKFWRLQSCGSFDDFFQDVMVRLFAGLSRLKDRAAFPGLFRRMVVATAADYWRKQGPHKENLVDIDLETLESSFDEQLSAPLIVRTYLDRLPPREKEVIQLAYFDDLDPVDIARRLGLKSGSVRMAKTRALRRLREMVVQMQKK